MFTTQQISKITRGHCLQPGRTLKIRGISIDSRTIKKGHVYIAVKGQRLNGHDFIAQAARRGAVAVIVSRKVACPEGVAVIMVKNTTKALGQIAAWHRKQFAIPVIAVTGSAGKTTTKEMIAAVLGKRYKVLKNFKTENNQFGVPLTLLKLKSSHDMAVLELGTNQRGDIRWLARVTAPVTAVFTNIGDSHLEGLKNRRGVFTEKSRLLCYLPPNGVIIYNGDDAFLKKLSRRHARQKIIRYGCEEKADVVARNVSSAGGRKLEFYVHRQKFTVHSPARHNVRNALAAITCGTHYKVSYNDIRAALARFRFAGSRQEFCRTGRYHFIDDSYNANPLSLASAIETLDALRVTGKRIVVCGDMLELGKRARALHRNAGRMIAGSQTDIVLTVGKYARSISEAVNGAGKAARAFHCADLKTLHQKLKHFCVPGDVILVKGSRGAHLERTVAYLKKNFK